MRRLIEHYRIPERLLESLRDSDLWRGVVADAPPESDGFSSVHDPEQVIESLLLEQYPSSGEQRHALIELFRSTYYKVRPLLHISVRKHLQRMYLSGWEKNPFPAWPVDTTVEYLQQRHLVALMKLQGLNTIPFIWFWPDEYDSCVIITHDVETRSGKAFCSALMDVDEAYGVSASFQIIPEERYQVTDKFLAEIRARGFGVNVHDLNHDGRLFASESQFMERVQSINRYGREFDSLGFRSGAMYRAQGWFHALEFQYDMSVPNVAHLDAQQGGCCTVFPYFIGDLLELPLTTVQDYALFNLLREDSIDIWTHQIGLIRRKHGLISILVHPDYIQSSRRQLLYRQLLTHLKQLQRRGKVFISTPDDVNLWWRTRSQLSLVPAGSGWIIQGAGSERARIAYACRNGDDITYRIDSSLAAAGSSRK